jgi:hypothetical protein
MKPKVIFVECIGEAHSNPFIDHCMVCLPYWATYPTCPFCGYKVYCSKRNGFDYYCKNCKKYLYKNDSQELQVCLK